MKNSNPSFPLNNININSNELEQMIDYSLFDSRPLDDNMTATELYFVYFGHYDNSIKVEKSKK